MLLKGVGEGPSALGSTHGSWSPSLDLHSSFFTSLTFLYVCSPFSFPSPFIGILGNTCLFPYLGH